MPTLILADNFTHRAFNTFTLPSTTTKRIWSAESNPSSHTFDTTKTRDDRGYMKVVEDGSATHYLRKAIAAGNRTLVGSFYFVVDSAPSVNSEMCAFTATVAGFIEVATDGKLRALISSGTAQTSAGSVADGSVHRVDFKFVTSGATYTLDVSLDGTALTQATFSSTAADISFFEIGTSIAADDLTFWMQDLVLSVTSGDHPIGAHRVHSLYPNGDGTHNISGAGDFDKADGTDITGSTTDAYTEVDDWATGAADTTTYIQDTAGASTEYVEVALENTAEATVWAWCAYAACFASSTTTCFLGVRVVDSGGTTFLDVLNNEDVSETTLRYWFGLVGGSSIDVATLNGSFVRIGLSTDVTPDPRCSAVMYMIAVPGDPSAGGDANVTPATIARSFTVPQAAPSAGVSLTPATIDRSFTVPQAQAGASITIEPATISRTFVLPQAGPSAGVSITPTTMARSFTLPQASPSAGVSLTPATLVRLFVIPQATAGAATDVTPGTIVRAFSLPQAAVQAAVVITPTTIARAFLVPQVTVEAGGNVTITPEVIARAFVVPQVEQRASSSVTPATVARLFAIPQATADTSAGASVTPDTIARAFTVAQVAIGLTAAPTPETLALLVVIPQATALGNVGPTIMTHAGPEVGGAASGAVLIVTHEGEEAGGAASGTVYVHTRNG